MTTVLELSHVSVSEHVDASAAVPAGKKRKETEVQLPAPPAKKVNLPSK